MSRRASLLSLIFAVALTAFGGNPDITVLGNRTEAKTSPAGIWEMTNGGAVFTIETRPGSRGSYSLVLLESPDFSVEPGTPFGEMEPTPEQGTFDLVLLSNPEGHKRASGRKDTKHFIIRFNDTFSRCTLKPYRTGRRINFRRMFPYLFGINIVNTDERPDGVDGAIRIDTPPIPVTL